MKTKLTILIITFLIVLISSSCHFSTKIAIVKNDTKSTIFVPIGLYNIVSDSTVAKYYRSSQLFSITSKTSHAIAIPGSRLNTAPDSSKCYLYIFNVDSLLKYEAIKGYKGLVKNSLIKTVSIQLNKIKYPLDTIYIK